MKKLIAIAFTALISASAFAANADESALFSDYHVNGSLGAVNVLEHSGNFDVHNNYHAE